MRVHVQSLAVMLSGSLLLPASIHAIEPGALNPQRPDYQLPQLPDWQSQETEQDMIIPPETETAPSPNPLSGPRFLLKQVIFEGNTLFSHAELQQVIANYLNQPVNRLDLETIRFQLSQYYKQAGFLSSGVLLPDQHIQNGIVKFEVIEGHLTTIQISGNEGLDAEYIQRRMQSETGEPLQQQKLLERFQILLRDPLIETLNGALKPGSRPGETVLDLEIKRAQPYDLTLSLDNYTPPSVGAYTGNLDGTLRNLTGWGDYLQLHLGGSAGMQEISAFYSIPVGYTATRLNIGFQASESEIVDDDLDRFDIENRFMDLNIGLSHPFYQTLNDLFSMELQYSFRQNRTYFDGEPIALSEGAEENGKSKVSVIRWIQNYLKRSSNAVFSASSSFNAGVDFFNATIHSDRADSRFFSWLGQLRYLYKLDALGEGTQLYLRSDIQLASETLMPLERFALGGVYTVRGYRQNELVRDNGYAASVELRYPLLMRENTYGNLKLVPFFDIGEAWNHDENGKTLLSSGIGLQWKRKNLSADFYWAHDLNTPDSVHSEQDSQDDGFYFQVQAKLL